MDENYLTNIESTDNIYLDACQIIDTAQQTAYNSVNFVLIQRNWLLGKRIAEEELRSSNRAEYGAQVIINLSKQLTKKYGKGFAKSNLYSFFTFYKLYPNIFQTLSGKSNAKLSWSHYSILIQVKNVDARAWYEQEAYKETWSVKTLQRNVSSQYYFRLLQSQVKKPVIEEMHQLTSNYQQDKLEFISEYS